MKRICCIISLFVLCLTFNQAHAQRCLPGMKGLQVTGGMAAFTGTVKAISLITSGLP